MGSIARLLDRAKNSVPDVWVKAGVPAPLLESTAEKAFEAAMLASWLSRWAGCSMERAVLLAIAWGAGDAEPFREARAELEEGSTTESKVAKLSHELEVFLQARRYGRMGLDTGDLMKASLKRILDLLEEINVEELTRNVHGILAE